MIRLVIPGRPITKKNHGRIVVNHRTGRPMVIPSEQYKRYETDALWHLKTYRGPTFGGPVNVRALYWLPDRRSAPDLLGLEEATADILERAGIVANDRLIVSWDGSRIAGYDKERPRVEIEITEAEEASA